MRIVYVIAYPTGYVEVYGSAKRAARRFCRAVGFSQEDAPQIAYRVRRQQVTIGNDRHAPEKLVYLTSERVM
jgi:hypothetical protein